MTLADDRRAAKTLRSDETERLVTYEDDPYTWALQQAELLHQGRLDLIDAANLADEIAALAHYLADKLSSDLGRILQHLLKWDHQSDRRSRSWVLSIREHRRRVTRHLKKAPGLVSVLPEVVADAFAYGRNEALSETDLSEAVLPIACPYTWDEIMSRPIDWPEPL